MAKQIVHNDEARALLKKGVDAVADAVKVTIGPRGRNVVLDKGYGAPTITNDGVSIAKEVVLKDKIENMGAEIVKEVATKTNDSAGDGTTTAIVLTQAIVHEGLKEMNAGTNVMGMKLGIETAAHEVVKELKAIAKQIKSKEEIMQIAKISAESEELGKIIAQTIDKVGKDGVVTVEESQAFGIESDIVEGMQFDKGYVSMYMVTDAERMEALYKDAAILLTDKKVASVQEILPLLEKLAQTGRKEIVIIADEIEGEALSTFVLNKLRGTFSVLAIKAPGYGDRKKELLEDIATVTGGTVITEDVGLKLENAELSMLGRAQKVIATKEHTTIVGGKGKKAAIEARVATLKKIHENTDSKFDKEKLEERIAKLSGGIAVIRVGAATETEMKYLKLKIEDAVNATRAAIEEGIVSGGGTALIRAKMKVEGKKLKSPIPNFQKDFQIGVNILLSALEAPLRQIITNAGHADVEVLVDQVKKGKGNCGYDGEKDDVIADMIDAGIIDPVKVTRSGVENAASASSILLTTEVAIAEEPKEEKPMMPPMGGMDY